MNEKIKNKREWVKTAAIIFLSVMLVLTFFSNTIMNYSLPEVATKYIESGSITAKIRGNGVVESGDPYQVKVKETRKVMSVAVREGDIVQAGDVLLYLAEGDSEELKAALKALETAQNAYELELLNANVDAGIISNAQSNISPETYRKQINAAQAAVEAAQADVDDWQEEFDEISMAITLEAAEVADVSDETEALKEAKEALDSAKLVLTAEENYLKTLTDRIAFYESALQGSSEKSTEAMNSSVESTTTTGNEELEQELVALREESKVTHARVLVAQEAVRNAQLAYDSANTELENKKNEDDNDADVAQLEQEKALIQVNLDAAKQALAEKQQELDKLTKNINQTLALETAYKAVAEAQKLVDEKTTDATEAVVTADIAGTVTAINAVAGNEISAAEPVVIIQPEGKGYSMSFTVTNEQARRLSVGDKAELINSWYYNDMDITLASIKPDKSNPGKQKLLTFDVTGDVIAGQSLNVSVGQKSANYDLIVPNSALREDNNGKFVLIVESKSSPLGNRFYARRVDVEVLASDDKQSAISGALYGYEFVITTSTQPVEAGQLVRLADN